jgi:hypothetical protein
VIRPPGRFGQHRRGAHRGLHTFVLAQVAVVHISVLDDAFSTTPLSSGDWLMCTALARFVLWGDEAKELVERVLHRSQPRPSELTFRRHRATLARGTTLGCGGVPWTTP